MKPQSLQDAIKANALKRQQNRQNGGWKEPVVKQHKITAEDMSKSPRVVQSPPPSTPYSAAPPPANNQEIAALKCLVQDLVKEMKEQRNSIEELHKENAELKNMIRAVQKNNQLSNTLGSPSSTPLSPMSPRKVKELSTNALQPLSPISPRKSKQPASLEPHYPGDIVEAQRKDKVLRHFMKTKEGLFDAKYMSIREEKAGNIVCYKRKIYIPASLRIKTIQYYKRLHSTSESDALHALRKNCYWPDLEKDFYNPNLIVPTTPVPGSPVRRSIFKS